METENGCGNIKGKFAFLSYLWGMETYFEIFGLTVIESSYPTYEEWKRDHFFNYSTYCIVLILPMRNGNAKTERITNFMLWSFLSYLWGMETKSMSSLVQKTFFEFLSYLWGMETRKYIKTSSRYFFVLILPMRNGNKCTSKTVPSSNSCSYPTYEEWKHQFPWFPFLIPPLFCSYPTYEEWKLSKIFNSLSIFIRFLSYLWGMETFLSNFFAKAWILLFLSYLWGMETPKFLPKSHNVLRSYPTYEEWKLRR